MTDKEYEREWDEIIENSLKESIENGLFESEAELDNMLDEFKKCIFKKV